MYVEHPVGGMREHLFSNGWLMSNIVDLEGEKIFKKRQALTDLGGGGLFAYCCKCNLHYPIGFQPYSEELKLDKNIICESAKFMHKHFTTCGEEKLRLVYRSLFCNDYMWGSVKIDDDISTKKTAILYKEKYARLFQMPTEAPASDVD